MRTPFYHNPKSLGDCARIFYIVKTSIPSMVITQLFQLSSLLIRYEQQKKKKRYDAWKPFVINSFNTSISDPLTDNVSF